MIPDHIIQQVKEAADIVEVVEDFVPLKKSGQNYKAHSPFTNEKTPSFFVSPSKGIFKCFSSGKGGDAISFIMELEGIGYLEAIRFLAQKYNIEIEEKEASPEEIASRNEKESLFIILNFAKDFYAKILHEEEEGRSIGLSYFHERGFSEETIRNFELGYALDQWGHLLEEATKKQYSEDLLEKAGLIIKKEDKKYDRFRGRVIFPIHNVSGKVVGFGARILTNDKKQPKYINSPETEVYDKSRVLYGLFQAKNAIRNTQNCYLVEGYTDVISLHQAGITNVVSSSGTSLTENQIGLIKRYSNTITILYDGDPAGIKASLRGIDLILEKGLQVNIVTFPEGEDPDSYVQALGGDAFSEYLEENSKDFINFRIDLLQKDIAKNPLEKANLIRDIIQSISKIPDAIQRQLLFKTVSDRLEIDEQLLISEYNKEVLKSRRKKSQEPGPETSEVPLQTEEEAKPEEKPLDGIILQEGAIIKLLLNFADHSISEEQDLYEYLLQEIEDIKFESEIYRKIIETYKEKLKEGFLPDTSYLISNSDEDVKREVVDLIAERYLLSENWEKHKIYVPRDKDVLSNLTYKNILRLKWRKIKNMSQEVSKKLMDTESIEEQEKYQKIFMELRKTERELAGILGIVVS